MSPCNRFELRRPIFFDSYQNATNDAARRTQAWGRGYTALDHAPFRCDAKTTSAPGCFEVFGPAARAVDKARVIADAWTCERLSCADCVAVNSVICFPTDRKGRRDSIFDASFRAPVNTRKPGIFTGPHACDGANPRGGQRRRWRDPIGASGSVTCGGSPSPSSDRNRAHSPQTVIFWPSVWRLAGTDGRK